MDKLASKMFESAAKVGNAWSLAAFAIAALVLIVLVVLRKRGALKSIERILGGVVIAVVMIAAMPLIARTYLDSYGVYRLRVTVEDPRGMPLNDAMVTSSIGGEPKKVEGGWEFDIPAGSKPRGGKLTIYGEEKSAFLSGETEVELTDDYNPTAEVRLDQDRSAGIRGRVVDRSGSPIAGAQVSVVGYESEAETTSSLGNFELPAHAADGQQVQIAVFKKGFGSVSEWRQAGEQPATIVLGHK
jgi:hypothetical protein